MAGQSHYIMPLPTFHKPVKLLIVASPYYKDISDNQIAGAKADAIDGADSHSRRLAMAFTAATVIALPPSRPCTMQQGTG